MKMICFISIILIINSSNIENESSNMNNTSPKDKIIDMTTYLSTNSLVNSKLKTADANLKKEFYPAEWTNKLRVYIHDPDTLPTNVRNSPRGKIILKLPKSDDYEVWLNGVSDGWFKVADIEGINDETFHANVNGYIHGSILAVDTRNYGGETINLYSNADASSKTVYSFKQELRLTLISANKNANWIKVKYNSKIKGWIKRKWLCGSLRTNCS